MTTPSWRCSPTFSAARWTLDERPPRSWPGTEWWRCRTRTGSSSRRSAGPRPTSSRTTSRWRRARVRRAACVVRDALAEHGLASVPIATGSKGYHVVSPIHPSASSDTIAVTLQKFAGLLAAKHGEDLTIVFRVALRGERVFVDWLRNNSMATVIAPYSLRARPRATVATPLSWTEMEQTDPDAFGIGDLDRHLDRPDPLAELASAPRDTERFLVAVAAAFEASGLVFETFDRFRS